METTDVSITIEEMADSIVEIYLKNPRLSPAYLGDPGIGKTDVFELARKKLAEAINRPDFFLHTEILSQMMPEDLSVPWPTPREAEEGIFRHLVNAGFSFEENAVGILFLDEGLSGDTNMTKAFQNVQSSKTIKGKPIPRGVMISIASNKKENKAGVGTHNTAFYNRFIWIFVEATFQGWEKWARARGIHISIIDFLKKFQKYLHDFKPDRMINATPRQWEKVNDVLGLKHEFEYVCGLVGEGIAREYFAYRDLFGEFPDMKDIELHPDKAKVPKSMDAQFALANALAAWTTKKNWSSVVQYMKRIHSEYQFMYMRESARLHPEMGLKSTDEWEKYIYENQKDLI